MAKTVEVNAIAASNRPTNLNLMSNFSPPNFEKKFITYIYLKLCRPIVRYRNGVQASAFHKPPRRQEDYVERRTDPGNYHFPALFSLLVDLLTVLPQS
jgi:hypothetical protein